MHQLPISKGWHHLRVHKFAVWIGSERSYARVQNILHSCKLQ